MSLLKITEDLASSFTIETRPSRNYISSSIHGATGSVYIFPRHSAIEKEVQPLSAFSSSLFNDKNLDEILNIAKLFANVSSSNYSQVNGYMSGVYAQQASARKQQKVDIYRFNPPFRFNSNTGRKLATINSLMPYHRVNYHESHYNVSNYFCLNFFTSSKNPRDAVLLYPNISSSLSSYGQYVPSNAWSFDFWINPKYTTDTPNNDFKAGTIMHVSGVYALSLITGSSRDVNGYPDGFKLMLQVSSSANTIPSQATAGAYVFISNDNVLRRNRWHHVTIRHGGTSPLYNNGSGSFIVDGLEQGTFVLSTPLATGSFGATNPSVLCVGNYYEGTNTGASEQVNFFAYNTSIREGLVEMNAAATDIPTAFTFNHPLNAQIHDLKLYNKYLNDTDIQQLASNAPNNLNNLLFYLPPYFTYESPSRSFYLGTGGIPVTPFQTKDGSTHDLFNVTMSFGVGGQFINLENYTKDFATNNFPRLLNLTSSIINQTTDIFSANQFIYASGSNCYRQYIIMPCDNGQYYPNYDFLKTGSLGKFVNDLGNLNIGKVTLKNLVPMVDKASVLDGISSSIVDQFIGATPDNVSGSYSDSLAILHRTKDNSSNQCVIFDISNIYYGNRINPGSFILTDNNLSASDGKISITIKDNSKGGLYVANCDTEQATWSNIGNIFYDEGIILIKSPQLYFFGENYFNMSFKGEQNIHVMKLNLQLPPMMATSSSNPSYLHVSASSLANDTDQQFTWINAVYVHDENMNVIAKTHLAQPLLRRTGEKYNFIVKLDF